MANGYDVMLIITCCRKRGYISRDSLCQHVRKGGGLKEYDVKHSQNIIHHAFAIFSLHYVLCNRQCEGELGRTCQERKDINELVGN